MLLGVHALFAFLAVRTDWFGTIVKGRRITLIEHGRVLEEGLREASMTSDDFGQALRLKTKQDDPSKVRAPTWNGTARSA